MEEFPSIGDLFDSLSHDDLWSEIDKAYSYLSNLPGKFIGELYKKNEIKDKEGNKDIADYKYYINRYLFRSFRIYNSIILLNIFNQNLEAQMISRSLLDNIAETKYFIKSYRGKAMNLIELF